MVRTAKAAGNAQQHPSRGTRAKRAKYRNSYLKNIELLIASESFSHAFSRYSSGYGTLALRHDVTT